jgi:hypothetical protein
MEKNWLDENKRAKKRENVRKKGNNRGVLNTEWAGVKRTALRE